MSWRLSLNMNNPGAPSTSNPSPASLHPATHVSTAALRVSDLPASLKFYTGLVGLQILVQEPGAAVLGAGSRPILRLLEVKGAAPQPPGTTGLYHVAILFPDRPALARKIAQIAAVRYPFGYADHLVSEAFYLSDPDGNGLELYRDRPREEWTWEGGEVQMANAPIDFRSFYGEVNPDDPRLSDPAAPEGTCLGHMHLRIADLATALAFYRDGLGFDLTCRFPGALFLSAGGYHHHLGMNIWESRGGRPAGENTAGLQEFSIVLPDRAELERLSRQVEAFGAPFEWAGETVLVNDPFQNRIRLVV